MLVTEKLRISFVIEIKTVGESCEFDFEHSEHKFEDSKMSGDSTLIK